MKDGSRKNFKAGARIISHGSPALEAYLVLKGEVKVTLERDGRTVTLAELGAGAIFGESSLFAGGLYGADVEAATDAELAVITPADFSDKIKSSDPLLRMIVEMLIDRLRKTNDALLKSETREFMDIGWV